MKKINLHESLILTSKTMQSIRGGRMPKPKPTDPPPPTDV